MQILNIPAIRGDSRIPPPCDVQLNFQGYIIHFDSTQFFLSAITWNRGRSSRFPSNSHILCLHGEEKSYAMHTGKKTSPHHQHQELLKSDAICTHESFVFLPKPGGLRLSLTYRVMQQGITAFNSILISSSAIPCQVVLSCHHVEVRLIPTGHLHIHLKYKQKK